MFNVMAEAFTCSFGYFNYFIKLKNIKFHYKYKPHPTPLTVVPNCDTTFKLHF